MAGKSLLTLQKACNSEAQQIAAELVAVIRENEELRAQIERLKADSLEDNRINEGLTRKLLDATTACTPSQKKTCLQHATPNNGKIIPFKQALHRIKQTT